MSGHTANRRTVGLDDKTVKNFALLSRHVWHLSAGHQAENSQITA